MPTTNETKTAMKYFARFLILLLPCILCSGCLFRIEHDTTSPGARGVVLNTQTHVPVTGAIVAVSRAYGYTNAAPVSEALSEIRRPVVITSSDGRFSIRPERHSQLVFMPYDEPHFGPGGTLVVRCEGYQSATVQLWGDIVPIPLSAQPTNFNVVQLNPISQSSEPWRLYDAGPFTFSVPQSLETDASRQGIDSYVRTFTNADMVLNFDYEADAGHPLKQASDPRKYAGVFRTESIAGYDVQIISFEGNMDFPEHFNYNVIASFLGASLTMQVACATNSDYDTALRIFRSVQFTNGSIHW